MAKKNAFAGASEIRKQARNYGFFDGIGEGGIGQKGAHVRKKAEDFFRHDYTSKGVGNVVQGYKKQRTFDLAKKYIKQRSGR